MPGRDFVASVRTVQRATPDLITMPELPGRGFHAGMLGRGFAVAVGLPVQRVSDGWRLAARDGLDQKKALRELVDDLDTFEQVLGESSVPSAVKVQVAGPWTLAASTGLSHGDRAVSDPTAREDIAAALATGVAELVREVKLRTGAPQVFVQVDEPLLPMVAGGAVPTATRTRRYPAIDPVELTIALRETVKQVTDSGGVPVLHCCAPRIPVAIAIDSGFRAISFDLRVIDGLDELARAVDLGVGLWPGAIPAMDAPIDERATLSRLERLYSVMGFALREHAESLVITPGCGLAGASERHAVHALTASANLARACGNASGGRRARRPA